jgi:hypothetical protein
MEEKTLADLRVPCFCPTCGGLMMGKSTNTFYDFGCCIDCFIYFLDGKQAKIAAWRAGWRPSQEDLVRMREFMKD